MSSAIRPRPMRRRTVPALGMALGMATVLALSACSSSGGSGNTNPGSSGGNSSANGTGTTQTTNASCPTATKKLNLGFVYADTTQNPMQEMAMGAKAAADQDGNVNLTESAPNGVNNTQEVQLLQSVARKATDGIRPGDIVLLHDADFYSARNSWERTASALPRILEELATRGLKSSVLRR